MLLMLLSLLELVGAHLLRLSAVELVEWPIVVLVLHLTLSLVLEIVRV
jgi:hypothetical protein